jgi:small redox-active disulfide protein 2
MYLRRIQVKDRLQARELGVVKVVGPGCPRCQETHRLVMKALAELGLAADVQDVSDYKEMAKLGVMFTPAVVTNNEVLCQGRIPTLHELKKWFEERATR